VNITPEFNDVEPTDMRIMFIAVTAELGFSPSPLPHGVCVLLAFKNKIIDTPPRIACSFEPTLPLEYIKNIRNKESVSREFPPRIALSYWSLQAYYTFYTVYNIHDNKYMAVYAYALCAAG
jgi:hypothetical protein